MAKQQVLVSDLTGTPIASGDEAKITVVVNGRRWELDVASTEVADLVAKGRETKRRGRPPKKAS